MMVEDALGKMQGASLENYRHLLSRVILIICIQGDPKKIENMLER